MVTLATAATSRERQTVTPDPDRIEHLLSQGVQQKVYPGATWAIGDADGIRLAGSCGLLDPNEPDHPMSQDALFDVVGLTKIIAVWPSSACSGTRNA
ncbi:hypothetical protein AB0392_04620 [Nonomuraea angiospora]|uniref:hypothetical protein n=1 Tax=Nonomuraea angiospora TaxID=46172 RepID=UPI0034500EFE